MKPLTRRDWTPEQLGVGSRAAYLWCPNGSAHSPLNAAVNGAIGREATSRNWATMKKLEAHLPAR